MDPILTLENNGCVCVWQGADRFSTAPNSQTLWSGRQSWLLSLSGWEHVLCQWPGARWDTLNHSHIFFCEFARMSLHIWTIWYRQMFTVLLCGAGNVIARTCASKSPNSYLICNLFISRVLCNDPTAVNWNADDAEWRWEAVFYIFDAIESPWWNVSLRNIHSKPAEQQDITFVSGHAWIIPPSIKQTQPLQRLHSNTIRLEHNDASVMASKATRSDPDLKSLWTKRTVPVLLRCVFEKLSQLEWIFADFLDRGEQEAVYGNVNHLLEEATGLEEVLIPAVPHQFAQFHTGIQVVVTVLWVDPKTILL